jgi:predicted lipoprotein with Yx(FWY)xxD motif
MKSLSKYILLFFSMVALTACGSAGSAAGSSYSPVVPSGTITSSHLVDGNGRTIYEYAGDAAGSGISNCTDANGCYAAWPAVPAGESISATGGAQLQQVSISSFSRTSPVLAQATYNGKPLYYFVSDTTPGEMSGDGVSGFSIVAP